MINECWTPPQRVLFSCYSNYNTRMPHLEFTHVSHKNKQQCSNIHHSSYYVETCVYNMYHVDDFAVNDV